MKWIIVDLFQDPKASASKTNDSTTVDVDAIESVTQVRRRVNRNNVFVSEVTTDIKLRDGMTVECIDSFKDVIAAIQLARNTEAIQRQAGNVFSTCIIDVREMVTERLKETMEEVEEVEEVEEPAEIDSKPVGKCPIEVGDIIMFSNRNGTDYNTEWRVTKVFDDCLTSWHGIEIYWHDAEDRQTALAGAREAVRAIEAGIFKLMARCN